MAVSFPVVVLNGATRRTPIDSARNILPAHSEVSSRNIRLVLSVELLSKSVGSGFKVDAIVTFMFDARSCGVGLAVDREGEESIQKDDC